MYGKNIIQNLFLKLLFFFIKFKLKYKNTGIPFKNNPNDSILNNYINPYLFDLFNFLLVLWVLFFL